MSVLTKKSVLAKLCYEYGNLLITERRRNKMSGVRGDILESRRIWEALGRQFAATTIDLYGYGNVEDIVTVITLKREYMEHDIRNKFEEYNESYNNNEIDDAFVVYLRDCAIDFITL